MLVVMPKGGCGLAETQRVVAWMANESSRQCGPCAFGLPALAEDLRTLLHGSRDPHSTLVRLKERCAVIDGRGACRHPDGVVRPGGVGPQGLRPPRRGARERPTV